VKAEQLWKTIVRREPYSLWDIPAFFLWLFSFVYRVGLWLRKAFAGEPLRVSRPVLSIGNITVGGSGKTPLVSFIAHDLILAGVRVGIVSSGYGRRDKRSVMEPGYKLQDMDATVTGDENKLLAMLLPDAIFSIDRVKAEAARRLADSGLVDMIIVDDGFQHFRLARDIDLVAYDAGFKRRWLKLFPYGMLREPRSALKRATLIIVTRAKFATDLNALKRRIRKINHDAPIYHAAFAARNVIGRDQTRPVKYLEDKSVFLFAGVGNFRALERQVSALAGDLDCACELSDHQIYDRALLEKLKAQADKLESDVVLTTAKDWVKLGDFDFGREFYYLDLSVDLDPGEEKLLAYLKTALKLPQRDN